MRMYHVTTEKGQAGIRSDQAVRPDLATGKLKASWFVPLRLVDWAILHVQRRHGADLTEVRILGMDFRPDELSNHAGSDRFFRKEKTRLEGRQYNWSTALDWIDSSYEYTEEISEGTKVGG